ncbi:ABC transporter permease [Streptomyces sp. NPDC003522]
MLGERATRELFGAQAQNASALVRTAPGVSPDALAARLQGQQPASSLVATPIESDIRRQFDSSTAFFRLMQGFLAPGLGVGITGLGVVMVRAVRERRRTIGILRALGFRARTVQRSFLWESSFIALEGILLGSLLGVLTTWLMYRDSAAFEGMEGGFPVEWSGIGGLGRPPSPRRPWPRSDPHGAPPPSAPRSPSTSPSDGRPGTARRTGGGTAPASPAAVPGRTPPGLRPACLRRWWSHAAGCGGGHRVPAPGPAARRPCAGTPGTGQGSVPRRGRGEGSAPW